jgi:hypothetical protein
MIISLAIIVLFMSACDMNPRDAVATTFPDVHGAVEGLVVTEANTPKAVVSTVISTLQPMATLSTTHICAFNVTGCPQEKCFSYFEIIEGTQMTDTSCDNLIQVIQTGLDADPDPYTGKVGHAERVYSYPTSPIICNKAYTGHSTLTIVDTARSEPSQKLCDRLP